MSHPRVLKQCGVWETDQLVSTHADHTPRRHRDYPHEGTAITLVVRMAAPQLPPPLPRPPPGPERNADASTHADHTPRRHSDFRLPFTLTKAQRLPSLCAWLLPNSPLPSHTLLPSHVPLEAGPQAAASWPTSWPTELPAEDRLRTAHSLHM